MNYKIYESNEDLAAFIRCYWTLEDTMQESPEKQTIVPDGCMEMIFHYGDPYKQYTEGGDSILQPKCFVIGQLTRPLVIEPTGKTGIFSVRFQPDGFLPIASIPIKEMENTAVSLERLFGEEGTGIEQKILNAGSTEERIKLVETFLLARLSARETIDQVVRSTVETILTANGQLSIDELLKRSGIYRRQLERKFSAAIGLSPKQLSRTIRLQATLKMLLGRKFPNLTALAYENEYYDQAHFIKEFK